MDLRTSIYVPQKHHDSQPVSSSPCALLRNITTDVYLLYIPNIQLFQSDCIQRDDTIYSRIKQTVKL